MKDTIRANLKMLEDNLDNFNKTALEFLDTEKIVKRLSEWRWFISHGYFKKGWPKPTGYNSNPPLGFLDSHLQGQSVPLSRDIAVCLAPVVQSGLMTEHAARRIMNRLDMLYIYVSPDDTLRSQQAHRDVETKKAKDRLRAQKAVVDRKALKKEEHKTFIEKVGPRLGKAYHARKKKERKAEQERREAASKATKQRALTAAAKMRDEMKERRK